MTAPNMEAPGEVGAGRALEGLENGPADSGTGEHAAQAHHVSQYGTDADARRKRLARLQAAYAMRGYALDELPDGTLMLSRWNLSRRLMTLDDAESWLARIGGAA